MQNLLLPKFWRFVFILICAIKITSDRGTAFTSKQFEEFISKHGIQHNKTAVRTPRANGQTERVNKTVINALKCVSEMAKTWDKMLPNIQWTINSQRNEVTKYTPNELVFYFNPRDLTYNRMIQAINDDDKGNPDIEVKRDEAANNIMAARNKWKERYDKRHQPPKKYDVGDLVVIDHVPNATGLPHKLDPAFKGPYIVTKVLNYDRYIIEDLPDSTHTQRRYCNICSVDHIKPWCALIPELDGIDDDDDSSMQDEMSGMAELSATVCV